MDAHARRQALGERFGERILALDSVFQTGADKIDGLPHTIAAGVERELSGMNLFVLLQVMKDKGWEDPRFFTAAQVQDAGWALRDESKGTGLSFFVATDDAGGVLNSPREVRFRVFNVNEIDGVPAREARNGFALEDAGRAAERAGYAGVNDWVAALVKEVGQSQPELQAALAGCLLQAKTGCSWELKDFQERAKDWSAQIAADPLSFFDAVLDAEKVFGVIMNEVQFARDERMSEKVPLLNLQEANAKAAGEKSEKSSANEVTHEAGGKKTSAKIAAMFLEREAVLAVPFEDKARAKELGAVWHADMKLWFAPKGSDVDKFKEWNPKLHAMGPEATRDVLVNSFMDAMESLGLDTSKGIVDDGKWHRVGVSTKKGKNTAGAYIVNFDGGWNGNPSGTIVNQHSGEKLAWRYEGELLTPEQRARLRADVMAREAEAAKVTAALQEAAAEHAVEICDAGMPAAGHGYAVKKGITATAAESLRVVKGDVLLKYSEFHGESGKSAIRAGEDYLVVPMTNEAGEIRAVQAISNDGKVKSFMRGAQKKGLMFVIGDESFDQACEGGKQIAYAEGVATGGSFFESSGMVTVVCFDAGNFETVVERTCAKLPDSVSAVLALDNDQFFVEKTIGYLAETLGVHPTKGSGRVIVQSGVEAQRSVATGGMVADGEWQRVAKGSYKVDLEMSEVNPNVVKAIQVEVVPLEGEGRKTRMRFCNRGLEAGLEAIAALEKAGKRFDVKVPEFGDCLERRLTDWNDFATHYGPELTRRAITGREVGPSIEAGASKGVER